MRAEIGLLRIVDLPEVIATKLKDTNGDGAFTPADTGGSSEKAIKALAHATAAFYEDNPVEVTLLKRTLRVTTTDGEKPNGDNVGTITILEQEVKQTLPTEAVEPALVDFYTHLVDSLRVADQLARVAQKIGGLSSKTIKEGKGKSIPPKKWDGMIDTLAGAAVNLFDLQDQLAGTILSLAILDNEGFPLPKPEQTDAEFCWSYIPNTMRLTFLRPVIGQLETDLGLISAFSGIIFCRGDACADQFLMPNVSVCLKRNP
ncbi:MAG: hypothetical protein A3H42_00130 [Deltaproteobacteria bacterium RIFCSPLOWO2_02_FULL_46_8]|nr:MAG: hypothetical protein A3H42_00130 [Deltaproteobacteria bacterium RIFCSPLOWO2_02_FULL_46_8]